MERFIDIFSKFNWDEVGKTIHQATEQEVIRSIRTPNKSLDDFAKMLSPLAQNHLAEMIGLSSDLTAKRFGKTVQMYAPMYLSNECQNICTYCGFSFDNKLKRKTLSNEEILQEIQKIKDYGFDNILLVTGEANRTVGIDYMLKAIDIIKAHFSQITIEVQPLETEEYCKLHNNGVYGVLVYQETYHKEVYKEYHPKGKKANFEYRLDTPDRIGDAEMHKIGLGVLLGLENWRTDSFFNALHLDYLQKKYWKTKFSISFPRLRPAVGVTPPKYMVTDKDLVQLICAYRLFNQDVELSLSTREDILLRNNAFKFGITSMSAGSKTNPGGYSVDVESLEQFEVSDERSAKEVATIIQASGFTPVWKDWDTIAVYETGN